MMLSWVLAFVLGVLSVEIFHVGLPFAKSVSILLIVGVVFVAFSWLLTHPKRELIDGQLLKRRDRHRLRTTVFIWLGVFMFGWMWAFVYEWYMTPSLDPASLVLASSDGRPFIGYGKIISTPDVDGQTVKLIVQMEGINWDVRAEKDDHDRWIVPLPDMYEAARHHPDLLHDAVLQVQKERIPLHPRTIWVNLKLQTSQEKVLARKLTAGDRLLFTGLLQPRSAFKPMTPGGFDFSHYLWTEGIEYTASGQFASVLTMKRGPFWNAWKASFIDRVRAAYEHAPQSVRALALAIVFGDKREISDEMRDAFQNAGVYHLLVVSGIHFAILTGAFYALLGFLGVSPNRRGAFILIFIFFYAWLASGSIAVVRAAWMGSIYWIGEQLKLRLIPWIAFSIPLIVSLLLKPRQLFSIGFLMTFVLTAALIRYTPSLTHVIIRSADRFSKKTRHQALSAMMSWVRRPGVSSFLAMLVLTELLSMVFLLTYFNFWPGLTPLANALLLPFYTLVLPLVAVLSFCGGCLAWMNDALAQWIVLPGAYALWLIEKIVMMFAALGRFLRMTIQGGGSLWAIVTMSSLFFMFEMAYRRLSWQSLLPLYPGPRWLEDTIAFRKPLRTVTVFFLTLAVLFVPVLFRSYAVPQKTGVFFIPTASVRVVGVLFPGKQAVLIVEDAPLERPAEPWRRSRTTASDMQKNVVPTLSALGVTRINALIVPETLLHDASPAALRAYSPIASFCRSISVEMIYVTPAPAQAAWGSTGSRGSFSDREKEALQALCPSATPALWTPNAALVYHGYRLFLTFPDPPESWLKRVPVWTVSGKDVSTTLRAGAATVRNADGKTYYLDYRPRYDDVPPWFETEPPEGVYSVAEEGYIWIDLVNGSVERTER